MNRDPHSFQPLVRRLRRHWPERRRGRRHLLPRGPRGPPEGDTVHAALALHRERAPLLRRDRARAAAGLRGWPQPRRVQRAARRGRLRPLDRAAPRDEAWRAHGGIRERRHGRRGRDGRGAHQGGPQGERAGHDRPREFQLSLADRHLRPSRRHRPRPLAVRGGRRAHVRDIAGQRRISLALRRGDGQGLRRLPRSDEVRGAPDPGHQQRLREALRAEGPVSDYQVAARPADHPSSAVDAEHGLPDDAGVVSEVRTSGRDPGIAVAVVGSAVATRVVRRWGPPASSGSPGTPGPPAGRPLPSRAAGG